MTDDIDRYKDGAVTLPDDPVQEFSDWVPDEALAAMVNERTVYPERSTPDVAKRIFDRNAPVAAQAIVHIALHSQSETQRLRAAMYITDRSLGKIGDENKNNGTDPMQGFFTEIQEFAAKQAQGTDESGAAVPNITSLPKEK